MIGEPVYLYTGSLGFEVLLLSKPGSVVQRDERLHVKPPKASVDLLDVGLQLLVGAVGDPEELLSADLIGLSELIEVHVQSEEPFNVGPSI